MSIDEKVRARLKSDWEHFREALKKTKAGENFVSKWGFESLRFDVELEHCRIYLGKCHECPLYVKGVCFIDASKCSWNFWRYIEVMRFVSGIDEDSLFDMCLSCESDEKLEKLLGMIRSKDFDGLREFAVAVMAEVCNAVAGSNIETEGKL